MVVLFQFMQVSLTSDFKKKIVTTHVKDTHQLREALDHIDIVLGFLAASSSGEKQLAMHTLKEYAQDTLGIENFNETVCDALFRNFACKNL